MKKRKELDALVPNDRVKKKLQNGSNGFGSADRSAGGGGSSHELLRVDSDTTDTEDFSVLHGRKFGTKKTTSVRRICSSCLPLCVFTLVTASIVGLGTLIWLQLGLREEVDLLRDHIRKVEEGNRGTPTQFHDLHSKIMLVEKNSTALRIEVDKFNATLIELTKRVDELKKISADLQQRIAENPAIENLPKQVETNTKEVANFGSQLGSLGVTLNQLKDEISKQGLETRLHAVEDKVQEALSSKQTEKHDDLNKAVQDALMDVNTTLGSKIQAAWEDLYKHNTLITETQSTVQNLSARVSLLEAHPPTVDGGNNFSALMLDKLREEVSKTVNASLLRLTESPNLPQLVTVDGVVKLQDVVNYVKNLTNLYILLLGNFQKMGADPVTVNNVINNLNASLAIGSLVNDSVAIALVEDRKKFQLLQLSVNNLRIWYEQLRNDSEGKAAKLSELNSLLQKLATASPPLNFISAQPLVVTNATTVKANPSSFSPAPISASSGNSGGSSIGSSSNSSSSGSVAGETAPAAANTAGPTLVNSNSTSSPSPIPSSNSTGDVVLKKPSMTGGSLESKSGPAPTND